MQILRWFILVGSVFLLAPSALAQSFTLQVEHEHTLGNCRGTLVITPEKIAYQTAEKRDAQSWEYREIRQLTVVSSIELELASYEDQPRMMGRDRIFKFRLTAGRITPEISALLAEKVTHPLVTAVPPQTDGTPQFVISVKHLHALGGCAGTLKIYADRIVFESQTDARFWRYSDIQNFSHSERFRFEIVGYEDKLGGLKAYNFQLKEDLPALTYDYVWERVYPAKFRRSEQLLGPQMDMAHMMPSTVLKQRRSQEYFCPMHPEVVSTKEGACPKCNMKLVKKQATVVALTEEQKKKVPGYPQDMMMILDDEVAKPETFGLAPGWTASMMGMMTLVRVLPADKYNQIVALVKKGQPEKPKPTHEHK